jgi:hypothetical protein
VVLIELRWCAAYKGVPGNEKADEWAKLAADEPDAHGMESLGYGDRYGRRHLPQAPNAPEALDHRDEAEGSEGAGREESRPQEIPVQPEVMPEAGLIPASARRYLASRFCQLETGHCLTRRYLQWTKNVPTSKCWWCRYKTKTREHLFKHCP